MSNLEKLPMELLENIFIFSMNLDLPRASPVIAGKLSSEIVYSQTILSAFSPTWDRWYGRENPPKSEGNEQYKTSDAFDGDAKLQVGSSF